MLLSTTGNISVKEVTVHHWREFVAKVKAFATWGQRTQANMVNDAKQFLRRLESDHNINYGFIRNRDYNVAIPEGSKTQYTRGEVQTALQYAKVISDCRFCSP